MIYSLMMQNQKQYYFIACRCFSVCHPQISISLLFTIDANECGYDHGRGHFYGNYRFHDDAYAYDAHNLSASDP